MARHDLKGKAQKTGAAKGSACFLFHVKQFTYLLFAYIAIPLFFVAMLHNFKTVCLQSGADFLFSSVNDAGADEKTALLLSIVTSRELLLRRGSE